eukprot:Colp12_sorted_trinity150504_noHs@8798
MAQASEASTRALLQVADVGSTMRGNSGQEPLSPAVIQVSAGVQQPISIAIQRDYSHGTAVRFETTFPEQLSSRIREAEFQTTINTINATFDEAEAMTLSTKLFGCLACLSGFTLFLCMETRYEKCIQRLEDFIYEQNESIYGPKGLRIIGPMHHGLRLIEIKEIGPVQT